MDKARYTVKAPPSFVLNLLSSRKFHLKKIKKGDRFVSFTVNSKICKEIEEVMQKQNLSFNLDYIKGSFTATKNLIKRYGLLVGVGACVGLCVLYALTLTSVKVEGLSEIPEETILKVIEEGGIKTPSIKTFINTKEVEENILKIEGVAFVTIEKEGSSLYVKVVEELPQKPIIDTQTPIPLVATQDGVITQIITVQGTPLVKPGATVKKGQVLIAPYIKDAEEEEIPLRAMGEVYAKVWYQNSLLYQDRVISEVRTGREETKYAMEVLGLGYLPKSSFTSYETRQTIKRVGGILPYNIVKTTFYETKQKEVDFNFQEKAKELIEREMEKLKATLPEEGKILRSWFLVKKLDNCTKLSIYYELEVKII